MRILQILTITLFAVLFSSNASGISIIYNGFECQNAVNANDPTPTTTPIQSRFEVIEDVGDGIFRLRLTGGLPRFINNNQNVCIDSETAIGFATNLAEDILPSQLEVIDATAYYDGQELVITVNSIHTDLSQSRNVFSSFSTSIVSPISNSMIFQYHPQTSSFKLKKLIHNRGFVHTSGSTTIVEPFFETIIPTFFGDSAEDRPRILTPLANIEYFFE